MLWSFLPYLIFLYCCLILLFLGASMAQCFSCPEPFSNAASPLQLVSKLPSLCSALEMILVLSFPSDLFFYLLFLFPSCLSSTWSLLSSLSFSNWWVLFSVLYFFFLTLRNRKHSCIFHWLRERRSYMDSMKEGHICLVTYLIALDSEKTNWLCLDAKAWVCNLWHMYCSCNCIGEQGCTGR